jgi:leucine dehydrogenase
MNTSFHDELLRYAENLGFGDLHIKLDAATGLCAIIAIHSTKRGPALGGCRCIEYHSVADAVRDALRLARGMSFKAAISDLPLGGGKSVLIKPKHIADRHAYFVAFGRFVNELGGRYITAMDSGTEVSDMESIAQATPYVTTVAKENGDPGPYTALGVLRGIEAAVKFKFNRDYLEGLHVAIQGVGHVGYNLAKGLHEQGVTLTVCDRNPHAVQKCVDEFGAKAVSSEEIYQQACDIFAPCALGAIINDDTIPLLQTNIVAGSANNQLAEPRHEIILQQKGILYAPDYVINAGGLIHAFAEYDKSSTQETGKHINHIYDTLLMIFERAAREQKGTGEIADIIASERL